MFFLRSKGRSLRARDPESGKMQAVGPRKWIPFGELPRGTTELGDTDMDVRIAKTQEDLAAIEAENVNAAEEDALCAERRAATVKPAETQEASDIRHEKRRRGRE
jgi:hypothetical protein